MDGIIVIRKEAGYTSNDVVAILRGILHMKKIGHTGTLDPDAEGCLPMCLGKGTRMADVLTASEKEYEAQLQFGFETDTGDLSGKVTRTAVYCFEESVFREAVESMVGDILQVPPMYSALKVGGVHLYDLARSGKEVERKARPIHIESIDILSCDAKGASIRVRCSKGTYIRTLIEDIGRKCGYLASMAHLNRTRSGRFSLENALTLAEVKEHAEQGTLEQVIFPMESFFTDYPRVSVSPEQDKLLANGNPLMLTNEGWKKEQVLRICDSKGQFKALYRVHAFQSELIECRAWKMF